MTPKDFRRVEVLRDAGRVKRLHTVDTVSEHNLERHVYGSMIIAEELCRLNDIYPGEVLRILLIHDAPEVETGDIPAPVKRECEGLQRDLWTLESDFYNTHDIVVPTGTMLARDIVKAADTLDLAYAMLYEARRGNKHPRIIQVMKNCLSYLREQAHVKGVDEFVKHLSEEFRYA